MRLIPIIGSGSGEQYSPTFAPDEEIPESGIYQIVHESGEQDRGIFIRGGMFPPCDDCGNQVRYSIVRTAPHIFDDEDFR